LFVLQQSLYVPAITAADAATSVQKDIIAMRGFLYYHQKGIFDKEDIFSGRVNLRNVIMASNIEGPSGAMLVLVRTRYPLSTSKLPNTTFVKLSLKDKKRELSAQQIPLKSFFSEKETVEIPFIVTGLGCDDFEVTASLIEQNKVISRMSRSAGFYCRE
jgi:hypothetical protein